MKNLTLAFLFTCVITLQAAEPILKLKPQDIDTQVEIGYGLAIADVDGDKKPDILLADKQTIQWYHNPTWQKHVIARNLTEKDNVCIAATDLDGDGKCEVAVGAGWAPADTENSGAVFYLIPPADRTQPWTPVALHHEPTVHRMHWIKNAAGKFELVVKPLHGRGNKNNAGAGGKVFAYAPPADMKAPWKLTLVSDQLHASHNFQPINWDKDPEQELILGSLEGVFWFGQSTGAWKRRQLTDQPTGELRDGVLASGKRFLATIEPMHGTTVCAYLDPGAKGLWTRRVLDDTLKDGHALAIGDLLGTGSPQVVAGWRAMTPKGVPGVKLYVPNADGTDWRQHQISGPEVAVEDLKLADLNGDGKLDLILAGRQTKNLRILWNQGR